VGDNVLVIGGGLVGCETADYLSERGKSVTIVEVLERMADDMVPILRRPLMDRLKSKGVKMFVSIQKERIEKNQFIFMDRERNEHVLRGNTVILATGGKPQKGDWENLKSKISEVYFVGDVIDSKGKILDAVAEGTE